MAVCLIYSATAVSAAAAPAATRAQSSRAAILNTIHEMEESWNRGDFRGYMAGFKNPGIVFVSGGKFQGGWQSTLEHYVRDYGGAPERRGILHFYNMKVDILSSDAAMLIGQYRLVRGPRITEGVNTRLFRKIDGKWLITMNHVSAYDVTGSAPATH